MAISTLGYALLGLLARRPCSGYDLGRQLKFPTGFYWQARYSQIYPELTKLEAAGLATFELVEQQDLPDKKVYTITEAGRVALTAWTTTPSEGTAVRDEFILKTSSLWLADPAQALALFRTHEEQHKQQLRHYEEFQQELETSGEDLTDISSPTFATYATLQAGLGYERAYVAWCRWVITQLEQAELTSQERKTRQI